MASLTPQQKKEQEEQEFICDLHGDFHKKTRFCLAGWLITVGMLTKIAKHTPGERINIDLIQYALRGIGQIGNELLLIYTSRCPKKFIKPFPQLFQVSEVLAPITYVLKKAEVQNGLMTKEDIKVLEKIKSDVIKKLFKAAEAPEAAEAAEAPEAAQ